MKKLFTFLMLLFVFAIIYYLNNPKYSINYDVEFINYEKEEEKNIKLCLLNENGESEFVDYSISKDMSDKKKALLIMELANEKRNSLPLNYSIGFYSNFKLKKLEENNKNIKIEIEDYDGDNNSLKTYLYWTYKQNDFSIETLKINKDNFDMTKEIPINNKTAIINSDLKTIFYFRNSAIYPVSYNYEGSYTDMIFTKLIDTVCTYEYEIDNDIIFVNLIDKSKKIKQLNIMELEYNLKNIFPGVSINLNGVVVN